MSCGGDHWLGKAADVGPVTVQPESANAAIGNAHLRNLVMLFPSEFESFVLQSPRNAEKDEAARLTSSTASISRPVLPRVINESLTISGLIAHTYMETIQRFLYGFGIIMNGRDDCQMRKRNHFILCHYMPLAKH